MKRHVAAITILLLCCTATMAQAPAQPPRKTAPPADANPRVDRKKTAPQVVTVVHRLNGLKMFRLLLRSQLAAQEISSLDSAFTLRDDVQTNVLAGVAMDDGQIIATWLPEVELGFSGFGETGIPFQPEPGRPSATPTPISEYGLFDVPNITVIGPDGKQLLVGYLGLDAVTGLSILKVVHKSLNLVDKSLKSAGTIKDEPVDIGESVRLFGPEPVTGQRGLLNSSLYVRIGATEGRVFDVRRAPSGGIARFKVSSPRLSQAIVGGVAVNDEGETVGIVNGLEGGEASVLPAAMIRRAVQRVVERQGTVPRPYLGVRGEAVSALKVDQILNHGWTADRAAALAQDHRGILLTAIVPDSPAAQAELRVGDVILKVNDQEISNDEDFTWLLEQAGPNASVSFSVARPDQLAEEALNVKLSGVLGFGQRPPLRRRGVDGFLPLIEHGIETIALRAPVASQLGTTAGLLVVYVEPSTPAFDAGLQPGDVIQSINGQSVSMRRFLSSNQPATFTFEVMRNKQKRTVTIANPPKKK